jgi:hypothetical protein
MRLLTTFTLMTICLTAIGQTSPTKKDSWFRVDTLFTEKDKRQKTLIYYSYAYIDTEIKYTDSTGKGVIIQNSLPKGGRGFTDATGRKFGYRVFWTRVINEAATPLELTINFPADSFPLPSPDSYMKVFLPPDTMTLDKETLHDYGATGLKSFFDTVLHTPTMLQRTINPKQACLFYIVVLRHHSGSGTPRGGLVLKEQDLFYKINPEFGSALIPCGKIVFRN